MNRFLAGAIALSIVAPVVPIAAQTHPVQSMDALYESGRQHMAPNWSGLGKTYKSAVFIHNDIRKADNGQYAVWTHNELPGLEYLEKEKAYLSVRDRMLIDCKSSRLGISDQAYYAERFAHGAVVGTNRVKTVDMREIVPDSIEELLVKTVCAPKPRKAAAQKVKAAKKPAE